MTDQKKDRLIVEALGECWHEFETWGIRSQCKKCKINQYGTGGKQLDLATPEGFFWWWPRMLTQEWANEFLAEDLLLASTPKFAYRKIDPIVGRDKLVEFLERRNLGKTPRITF